MKKYSLLILLFSVFYASNAFAQDFSYPVNGAKKVSIKAIKGNISLEAHSGSDIKIQAADLKIPKEAEGLKVITLGVEDNTGKGFNIQQVDGNIQIMSAQKRKSDVTILIPQSMAIHVELSGTGGGDIHLHKFTGELEIKTSYNDVFLHEVSGPVLVNSTYGSIQASFDKLNPDKPSSLVSAYKKVDVTLSAQAKANLVMESTYGDIFSNLELSKDENSNGLRAVSRKKIEGKYNGGGVELYLKSPYGNIYLRKAK